MFYKITRARDRWLTSAENTVRPLLTYIEQKGQMRDAQIDAIKTYLFLKIRCESKPLYQLFSTGAFSTVDIKLRAEEVLNVLGIPVSAAIDIYLSQIALTDRIPFAVTIPKARLRSIWI